MSRIIRPEPRVGLATRREVLAGAAALGLAAATLLPGAARAQETPQKGGRLRVGLADGSTTDTLDPQTYTGAFMLCLGFATHSTLTEISPEGELVGDAAEGWESSKDAATWTFKLRRGVTFSDGKPMTVEDVIGSLAYHGGEDSKSGAKEILDRIAEMKQDGDDTIVFELAGGNADFPYLMADYHLLIMQLKDGKPDWRGYVGTGGYVLESFEPGVAGRAQAQPELLEGGQGTPGRGRADRDRRRRRASERAHHGRGGPDQPLRPQDRAAPGPGAGAADRGGHGPLALHRPDDHDLLALR